MKKRSLYLQEAVTKLGVYTGYFGVFSLLSWQELQYKTGTPGDGDKCQKKVSAEIGAGEKRAICCRQAFLKWQEQLLHKKGWEMFVTPTCHYCCPSSSRQPNAGKWWLRPRFCVKCLTDLILMTSHNTERSGSRDLVIYPLLSLHFPLDGWAQFCLAFLYPLDD